MLASEADPHASRVGTRTASFARSSAPTSSFFTAASALCSSNLLICGARHRAVWAGCSSHARARPAHLLLHLLGLCLGAVVRLLRQRRRRSGPALPKRIVRLLRARVGLHTAEGASSALRDLLASAGSGSLRTMKPAPDTDVIGRAPSWPAAVPRRAAVPSLAPGILPVGCRIPDGGLPNPPPRPPPPMAPVGGATLNPRGAVKS